MTHSAFDKAAGSVRAIDTDGAGAAADARTDLLTKPRGSLGRLEALGTQLAAIARTCPPPVPTAVTVCVFAGDHGVLAQGVSPWPQEVTAQMVANFCAGGAAVNVLARQAGASVLVIDVGVATPIPADSVDLLHRNIRFGTADLSIGPAMEQSEARAALSVGAEVAAQAIASGAQLLVTGEMGIGNTTPAAALISAFTGLTAAEVTGRGTGIDDRTLIKKTTVVHEAVARLAPDAEPLTILAEVGGLEIAALAGLIIGGAAAGVPVLVDGVIAASAAMVACAMVPDARGYLIAGHLSVEPGAAAALRHLQLTPLLDLGMRLGEGSGATLAIPLVQAAARILSEMATFNEAKVDETTNTATTNTAV
ncbi:MAG: nicotinate-nucleotide--dimethylbenzimidazole phosphoribosyltransferase [Nakamurella sp.]